MLLPVSTACSLTTRIPLPQSMKGYELYSWNEAEQWHFTLITGTDRNKTLEEITTGESVEREDGWVNLHVVGAGAVKALLARMPKGESVIWWNHGGFVTPPEQAAVKLVLPPEDILNEITAYALGLGLDFSVQG